MPKPGKISRLETAAERALRHSDAARTRNEGMIVCVLPGDLPGDAAA